MDLIPLSKGATELLVRLFGPMADEAGAAMKDVVGTLVSDRLREARRRNLHRLVERAAQRTQGAERETSTAQLHVAVPLLERASLYDDDGYIGEYWASLIASAADGHLEQTNYISILSEMGPPDALVFSELSQFWEREDEFRELLQARTGERIALVDLTREVRAVEVRREGEEYRCDHVELTVGGVSEVRLQEVVENLRRLALVDWRWADVRGNVLQPEAKFCYTHGGGISQTAIGRGFWTLCSYGRKADPQMP